MLAALARCTALAAPLAALALWPTAPGLPGAGARLDDGSLEGFLRRVRSEREAEYERLRSRVDELATALGRARSERDVERVRAELAALGSEAPPLLVGRLDPGAGPDKERLRSSEEVARFLADSHEPALLEPLVRLSESGSPRGRILAVRVLGAAGEPELALPHLRGLFERSAGDLRAECVHSLARLAPDDPLLTRALADESVVVRAALLALAESSGTELLPAALELARDPERASPVLAELVRYFQRPGVKLDEETVTALVRLAGQPNHPTEARLAVLRGLPDFGVTLSSRLRREIEPLTESADTGVREEALIALTLLKDSRSKRELMRYYDDLVAKNERWAQGYQRRGDIELRIGDYGAATRDYQKAIEIMGNSARVPGNRQLWIDLARACIKDGKLRTAAEALETFGLNRELRDELRADPDFAPLAASSRYGKLLD